MSSNQGIGPKNLRKPRVFRKITSQPETPIGSPSRVWDCKTSSRTTIQIRKVQITVNFEYIFSVYFSVLLFSFLGAH